MQLISKFEKSNKSDLDQIKQSFNYTLIEWTYFYKFIFSDSELAFLPLLLPALIKEKLPLLYAKENEDILLVKPFIYSALKFCKYFPKFILPNLFRN